MAKTLTRRQFDGLTRLCHTLSKLPSKRLFVDYDEGADVLYICFRHPAKTCQSGLTEDDILLEFDRKGGWVEVTILDVSRRSRGSK
ncbi:MAG: DUF2283 domain-containing protein [Armatimonadota bacterium]|nr:DUF2283 domain-containing protein [Armatimonadota bacterium]MDW8142592.1 DUF2283 domain-containing protein [Armatimonadota bacterium]